MAFHATWSTKKHGAKHKKASQSCLSVENSDFIRNIYHGIQDVRQMETLNVRIAIFDAICHQQVVTIPQQSARVLDAFTILGRNWNFGFAWVAACCYTLPQTIYIYL